jgi:two-component system, chemotaxis family, response regulator Rcp1
MKEQDWTRPVVILLVEDNPGDARLTIEAFKEGKLRKEIHRVVDGVEALAFLRQLGKFKQAPKPDLILLDLNLPKKNGKEVLEDIKKDPEFKRIPVVILSTSSSQEDIQRTYELQANCYIIKPADMFDLIHIAKMIEDFWLKIVRLPVN